MTSFVEHYNGRVANSLQLLPQAQIDLLFREVLSVWQRDAQVFICGNGGSAANALHIANDLFYGVAKGHGRGLRIHALSANQSIVTCFANDISYEEVFSQQLDVLANPGDLLIVLSGSGNSPNILKALERAKKLQVRSGAIVGFSGGAALALADLPVHVPVHDMQIAEDLQLILGHALMQWLREHRGSINW